MSGRIKHSKRSSKTRNKCNQSLSKFYQDCNKYSNFKAISIKFKGKSKKGVINKIRSLLKAR